jgi:hypothetical protein
MTSLERKGIDRIGLEQWFPTVIHLRTPWRPIFINFTLHIIKMCVINIVSVISNLYVDVRGFSRHYSISFPSS